MKRSLVLAMALLWSAGAGFAQDYPTAKKRQTTSTRPSPSASPGSSSSAQPSSDGGVTENPKSGKTSTELSPMATYDRTNKPSTVDLKVSNVRTTKVTSKAVTGTKIKTSNDMGGKYPGSSEGFPTKP